MTWDETDQALRSISKEIYDIYEEYSQKDANTLDKPKNRLIALRAEAIRIHYLRIDINMRRP